MTELTHLPCPLPDCDSSDAFAYNTETGMFYCHSCGESSRGNGLCFDGKTIEPFRNNKGEEGLSLEPYVKEFRGISKTIIEKHGVYFTENNGQESVHFQYPKATKHRNLSIPKNQVGHFSATGQMDRFFGEDDYSGGKVITVTEGEWDRLSVIQIMGDWPTVSVPSANPSKEFWQNAREYLTAFDKIILSVDNDLAGNKLADKFYALFPSKVYRVKHPEEYKDANDFLQAGEFKRYKESWWAATKMKPEGFISSPEQWEKAVREETPYEFIPTPVEALNRKIRGFTKGGITVVKALPGTGKSHAPNTPIMRYDGKVVRADEVFVGDELMGPDSKPRVVTDVNLQKGLMYRVTPTKGEPFECNADHILSLKHTSTSEINNVLLSEYLEWSDSKKSRWKLWRTGVDFPAIGPNQPSFAYVVGAYLGDGNATTPSFSMGKTKQSVIDYVTESGYLTIKRVRFAGNACSLHFSTKDKLWDYLSNRTGQSEDCLTERKMPTEMKLGHKETREAILAGLLDTDGNLSCGGAEITQKSEHLANDIAFVARSLGLAAYVKPKKGVIKSRNFEGDYFRVFISGDLTGLPCKRLKFKPRKQIKDVLKTGFKVESIGEGVFRGIALDNSDHLFLLGDFTVSHNSTIFRFFQHHLIKHSDCKIALLHMEEMKSTTARGLATYELGANVSTKLDAENSGVSEGVVVETIKDMTKDDRFITFDIDPHNPIEDTLDKIKVCREVYGVDFIFLDHLQRLAYLSGVETATSSLTSFAVKVVDMTRKDPFGVIAISHVNNDGATKYAKAVEEEAIMVMELSRDSKSEDVSERDTTHIDVTKNRPFALLGDAGCLTYDHETTMVSEKVDFLSTPKQVVTVKGVNSVKTKTTDDSEIPF